MPASQAVASCSNVIQQCGQFVLERVAPVATAALLATPTVAALAHQDTPADITSNQTVVETRENDSMTLTRALAKRTGTKETRQQTVSTGEPTEPTEEPVEPESPVVEEPVAPDPEPTTDPESETPDGEEEPGTEATPPPPSPPPGLSVSLALEGSTEAGSCACLEPNQASSSYIGMTSAGIQKFEQVLRGTMSTDGHDYGVWIRHFTTTGTDHSMEVRVNTSEGGYFYSASGNFVSREQTAWNGWTYIYRGSYKTSSYPGHPETMPSSGTYTVTVSASWEENRIVATNVTLHQDV
jgi:hypothetical protein